MLRITNVVVESCTKMTKLHALNAYFTERLMTAVQEIMKVLEDTLFEYQHETERTKRENEILRRRLLDAEAGFPQPVPPLCADRAVSEHEEWGSTGQDTESTLTAVKLEFSEPQRHRQEEEEHLGLESGTDGSVIPSPCSKRECGPDSLNQPAFPPPCGKRDSVQDPQNHLDLRLQIGNTEEEEGTPSVTHYQIKSETDGVDCTVSEEPGEALFGDTFNPASQTDQSENSGRVNEDISSRPMLMSVEQHSKEKPGVLQGESSLSCVHCGKVFIHVSRLKSHLRTHTAECTFRCAVCGKCFSQSRLLTAHQRVHTGNKPYCCSICGKSFNYLAKFKEHQRIHTGERPYRCSFCEFSPPLRADRAVSEHQEWGSTGQDTESTLTAVKLEFSEPQRHRQEEEKHRRLESGTDGSVIPSPCSKRECGPDSLNQPTFPPPCGKRDSVQDPQNHLDLRLQIGNTEEEEGTPSVTHYQIKTETDGADCTVSEEPAEGLFLHKINPASETDQSENSGRVDEDITSRSNLLSEQHSKEHPDLLQGDGSLSCAYCGKVFFLLSRLKSHLRSHTEDSSFQCSVCGKCFSQSGNLNVHQRVHTGKKPYCCSICGKSFNYSGKFKEHQRIHTGERPYRCSFCGKYFSQSGHLKAHVRIHTGEKPYRCPVCGTCFSQLSQIKRHLLTHTQEMALGSHSQGGELH
ncbi:endothelial zinc finger protein induced by tumor necrosis factor alpha-like isoform X2 [Anguilla rostrata]|uniref:endothelial zinc finger protein induced by tumor necrosis factor alpha-like isoform X2 n=1 Tax=Anguilla rostrata TaxID=7938 RepID=UPI0030CCB0E9